MGCSSKEEMNQQEETEATEENCPVSPFALRPPVQSDRAPLPEASGTTDRRGWTQIRYLRSTQWRRSLVSASPGSQCPWRPIISTVDGSEANHWIDPTILRSNHRPRTSRAPVQPRNFFNARTAVVSGPGHYGFHLYSPYAGLRCTTLLRGASRRAASW